MSDSPRTAGDPLASPATNTKAPDSRSHAEQSNPGTSVPGRPSEDAVDTSEMPYLIQQHHLMYASPRVGELVRCAASNAFGVITDIQIERRLIPRDTMSTLQHCGQCLLDIIHLVPWWVGNGRVEFEPGTCSVLEALFVRLFRIKMYFLYSGAKFGSFPTEVCLDSIDYELATATIRQTIPKMNVMAERSELAREVAANISRPITVLNMDPTRLPELKYSVWSEMLFIAPPYHWELDRDEVLARIVNPERQAIPALPAHIPESPDPKSSPPNSQPSAVLSPPNAGVTPGTQRKPRKRKLSVAEKSDRETAIRDYLAKETVAATEEERHRLADTITIAGVSAATGFATGWISTNSTFWKTFNSERERRRSLNTPSSPRKERQLPPKALAVLPNPTAVDPSEDAARSELLNAMSPEDRHRFENATPTEQAQWVKLYVEQRDDDKPPPRRPRS